MSMLNAAAPYRRDDRPTLRVPVVMPLVEATVDEQGRVSVLVDHQPHTADTTLQRDDLTRVLEEIAADLGTPIRVEVREADASTFTDIVTPPGRTPTAEPSAGGPAAALASPFGISGEGFNAGEEVTVCVVVARQVAGDDGTARLRLPPALSATHPGLVLLGRSSGTIALSEDTA
jgi:hypothetical protein